MSPSSENICDSSKCTLRMTILKCSRSSSARIAWLAVSTNVVSWAYEDAPEALEHVRRDGEKNLRFRRRSISGHPGLPSSSVDPCVRGKIQAGLEKYVALRQHPRPRIGADSTIAGLWKSLLC